MKLILFIETRFLVKGQLSRNDFYLSKKKDLFKTRNVILVNVSDDIIWLPDDFVWTHFTCMIFVSKDHRFQLSIFMTSEKMCLFVEFIYRKCWKTVCSLLLMRTYFNCATENRSCKKNVFHKILFLFLLSYRGLIAWN